ncbi:MAG: GNAT family N-acetyltransferase, partial [Cyclobacteriaceae bacterium]|nr:GNAT family N-acetyltransferase [Cyclobacteriaceae bacterium]
FPADHEELTEISHRSKRYWNYPEEYMLLWQEDLTISSDYIAVHKVFKLIIENKVIGFCSLEEKADRVEIGHFWIIPEYIGKGIGSTFLKYVMNKKVPMKVKVSVVADVKAEGFYQKHGFVKINEIPGKIKNRRLPYMVNYNLGEESD